MIKLAPKLTDYPQVTKEYFEKKEKTTLHVFNKTGWSNYRKLVNNYQANITYDSWEVHQDFDLKNGVVDEVVINNWRDRFNQEDLKRIAQDSGYSVISISHLSGNVAFKKFDYPDTQRFSPVVTDYPQVTKEYCERSEKNLLLIFNRSGWSNYKKLELNEIKDINRTNKPFRNCRLKLDDGRFICTSGNSSRGTSNYQTGGAISNMLNEFHRKHAGLELITLELGNYSDAMICSFKGPSSSIIFPP